MRRSAPIEEIWASGLFLGRNRADTRVTVDRDWAVREEWTAAGSDRTGFHSKRRPARYYQDPDVDEVEEIPNQIIKSIEITRQLGADTAGVMLRLINADAEAGPARAQQGRYSPRRSFRGAGGELRLIAAGDERWGDEGLTANEWSVIYTNEDVYDSERGLRKKVHSYGTLASGNIVRVYQGYGGADLPLEEALAGGFLVQTGCFVLDDGRYSADGTIELSGRDMGVLLLEQQLYPPLIPEYCYPMQFYSSNFNQAAGDGPDGVVPSRTNYRDLADPVRLIALWCGFHLKGGGWAADRRFPAIHGAIESTGIASESVLAAQMFDKKNAIDPIREISAIVSYMTWIDQEGGFRWHSPNIWEAGNFDYDGAHSRFAFEIDEAKGLLDYVATNSRKGDRSRFTVAQADPYRNGPGTTKIASYDAWTSSTKPQLHGMHNQATWSLYDKKANISLADMITLAELTGLRTWFGRRVGSVSAPALPLIDIDDQIRVVERVSFEMYLHRVLGITTTHDLDTGVYRMNINTHWLGADPTGWAIRISETGHVTYNSGTSSGRGRQRRASTSRQPVGALPDRDVWA